jgi:hypothetical protein
MENATTPERVTRMVTANGIAWISACAASEVQATPMAPKSSRQRWTQRQIVMQF